MAISIEGLVVRDRIVRMKDIGGGSTCPCGGYLINDYGIAFVHNRKELLGKGARGGFSVVVKLTINRYHQRLIESRISVYL